MASSYSTSSSDSSSFSDSTIDENEGRFLRRATALVRPASGIRKLTTSSENNNLNNNKVKALSSKRKRGEEQNDSAGNEEAANEMTAPNDEGERKQSSVAGEIEMSKQLLDHAKNVIRDYVITMVGEGNQQFFQESKIMVDGFKNELIKENQKQKDHIMNIASNTEQASFNIMAIYCSQEMLEEPLSNSEMKKLKRKWRQQKALELEASIKRFALMQEEIQMKLARIRTVLNNKSF